MGYVVTHELYQTPSFEPPQRMVKVLQENLGIRHGSMTTIHSVPTHNASWTGIIRTCDGREPAESALFQPLLFVWCSRCLVCCSLAGVPRQQFWLGPLASWRLARPLDNWLWNCAGLWSDRVPVGVCCISGYGFVDFPAIARKHSSSRIRCELIPVREVLS